MCFFGAHKKGRWWTELSVITIVFFDFFMIIPLMIMDKDVNTYGFMGKLFWIGIPFIAALFIGIWTALIKRKDYQSYLKFLIGFLAGMWVGIILYATVILMFLAQYRFI